MEVRHTGHFARAARNLALTQAAVSARIKQLETLVGQQLLTRARNNVQLTEAGRRLLPYAESMLASWNRALLDMSAGASAGPPLTIGCLPSLREVYLDEWLAELLREPVSWLLQLESWNTAEMIQRLREGAISVGIVYEPPRAADLWTQALTGFELVLVTTRQGVVLEEGLPGYVYVDWGTSFAVAHGQLAGLAIPRVRVDSPVLARHLLRTWREARVEAADGGTAYLARPMIAEDLAAARLFVVEGAPVMMRDVYLVGHRDRENDPVLVEVLAALERLVSRSARPEPVHPPAAADGGGTSRPG